MTRRPIRLCSPWSYGQLGGSRADFLTAGGTTSPPRNALAPHLKQSRGLRQAGRETEISLLFLSLRRARGKKLNNLPDSRATAVCFYFVVKRKFCIVPS